MFRGALVIIPGAITIFAFLKIFDFVDSILPAVFNVITPNKTIHWPMGTGALLSIIILSIIGYLVRKEVGRVIFGSFNALLAKTPYINKLFIAIQQILNSLKKQKNKLFREAVLIQYPTDTSYCIGFITGNAGEEITSILESETIVPVFVPTTPNPTSGFLIYVDKSNIKPLNISVETAIKIVMSAGTVDAKSLSEGQENNSFPDVVKNGEWFDRVKKWPEQLMNRGKNR